VSGETLQRRILLVEDNVLLADLMKLDLETEGFQVVGPVGRVNPGMKLATQEHLHGAVLDVNLAGEMSFPIAYALRARGLPFVFLTGYDEFDFAPADLRGARCFSKPVDFPELVFALREFAVR